MAYRFMKHEALPEAIRRVFAEEIDWAVGQLNNAKNRAQAVHEARKSIKKIRGLLRLIRTPLGAKYRPADHYFRNAGRQLSPIRDNAVILEVFDALTAKHDEMDAGALSDIRGNLERRRRETPREKKTSAQVARLLADALAIPSLWQLDELDFHTLSSQIVAVYKRGRRDVKEAQHGARAEDFHNLRKAVKQHWYHLKLLEEFWDRDMKQHAGESRDLETCLGDEHNLSILRERIAADVETTRDRHRAQRFVALLDDRAQALRQRALEIGRPLYAAKPRDFDHRLNKLWTEPYPVRKRPAVSTLRATSAVA
jgi:CHAD domain-containing protein